MHALDEVQPAFGVSEEELQAVVQNGIIHYSQRVNVSIAASSQTSTLTCRTYSKTEVSSWSRCESRTEHRLFARYCMVRRDTSSTGTDARIVRLW